MKIAVTGASGFIGSALVPYLEQRGHEAVKLSRSMLASPQEALSGCEVLIHLAGIAHRRNESFAEMDAANRQLPVNLAKCAERAGVAKFIFVSSVYAEISPDTPYGRSKAMAERDLLALDGIEVTVVRPPLVYGRGAQGNMKSLLSLSRLPMPLPFGAADRKRSLVYIGNLVDALAFVAERMTPGGSIFTVTDNDDVSVAQIVTAFRRGMGRPAWLFPAPWLEGALKLIGAGRLAEKMLGQLQFDSQALTAAGWKPPHKASSSLSESARER